jgi:hypothetical protein
MPRSRSRAQSVGIQYRRFDFSSSGVVMTFSSRPPFFSIVLCFFDLLPPLAVLAYLLETG